MRRSEIDHFRTALPDINSVAARFAQPFYQGLTYG